jgi:hypothetical protein
VPRLTQNRPFSAAYSTPPQPPPSHFEYLYARRKPRPRPRCAPHASRPQRLTASRPVSIDSVSQTASITRHTQQAKAQADNLEPLYLRDTQSLRHSSRFRANPIATTVVTVRSSHERLSILVHRSQRCSPDHITFVGRCVSRQSLGGMPSQFRNARPNELGSSKPKR